MRLKDRSRRKDREVIGVDRLGIDGGGGSA